MGNKKGKYHFEGVDYASDEEVEFAAFLSECKTHGLVSSFAYEPESYDLIPKATYTVEVPRKTKPPKKVEKTLYRSHGYTPDWVFTPTAKFLELDHGLKINDDGTIIVDIKGSWNKHGGDRIFPIHQKLMYFRFGLHVEKLIPTMFFDRINIVPDAVRWMKNRKTPTLRKGFRGKLSVEEYVKSSGRRKSEVESLLEEFKNQKFNAE